jgi:hypothetical protein
MNSNIENSIKTASVLILNRTNVKNIKHFNQMLMNIETLVSMLKLNFRFNA